MDDDYEYDKCQERILLSTIIPEELLREPNNHKSCFADQFVYRYRSSYGCLPRQACPRLVWDRPSRRSSSKRTSAHSWFSTASHATGPINPNLHSGSISPIGSLKAETPGPSSIVISHKQACCFKPSVTKAWRCLPTRNYPKSKSQHLRLGCGPGQLGQSMSKNSRPPRISPKSPKPIASIGSFNP